jgi:hypothetical protein
MKIWISNYRNHWISPYTILTKICFWEKDIDHIYNLNDKPDNTYYLCVHLKDFEIDDEKRKQFESIKENEKSLDVMLDSMENLTKIEEKSVTPLFLRQMHRIKLWMDSIQDAKATFVMMGDFNTCISLEGVNTLKYKNKEDASEDASKIYSQTFEKHKITISENGFSPKFFSSNKMRVLTAQLPKMFVEVKALIDYVVIFRHEDSSTSSTSSTPSNHITCIHDNTLGIRLQNSSQKLAYPTDHDSIIFGKYATLNCGGIDICEKSGIKDNIFEFCDKSDFPDEVINSIIHIIDSQCEISEIKKSGEKFLYKVKSEDGKINGSDFVGENRLYGFGKVTDNVFSTPKFGAFDVHFHPDEMPWVQVEQSDENRITVYKRQPDGSNDNTIVIARMTIDQSKLECNKVETIEIHSRLDKWLNAFEKFDIQYIDLLKKRFIPLLQAWYLILQEHKEIFTSIYASQPTQLGFSIIDVVEKLELEGAEVICLQEFKKKKNQKNNFEKILEEKFQIIWNTSQKEDLNYDTIGCMLIKKNPSMGGKKIKNKTKRKNRKTKTKKNKNKKKQKQKTKKNKTSKVK